MTTEPADDFGRWLASSETPPDKRGPDDLIEGIGAAIRSRDFRAVDVLMIALALADPHKAKPVYDVICAVLDGDERKAVLLAAQGGNR